MYQALALPVITASTSITMSASGIIRTLFNKPTYLFITMKTIDLLSYPEATLTGELKLMKTKELERHSRKLLLKLGLKDYELIMGKVIKAIARLDANSSDGFITLQTLIYSLLPEGEKNKVERAKLVERLAIVMMLLVTKKFHKIHNARD